MESAGLELGRTFFLRTHRLAQRALNQLSYQDRQGDERLTGQTCLIVAHVVGFWVDWKCHKNLGVTNEIAHDHAGWRRAILGSTGVSNQTLEWLMLKESLVFNFQFSFYFLSG